MKVEFTKITGGTIIIDINNIDYVEEVLAGEIKWSCGTSLNINEYYDSDQTKITMKDKKVFHITERARSVKEFMNK